MIVGPNAFGNWRHLATALKTSVMKAMKDMLPSLKVTIDWV